jgi:hypothetical protein
MTVLNPRATVLSDDALTRFSLRFEFETSFLEQYIASLTVLSRLPSQIAMSAVFPLAGLFLIFVSFFSNTFGVFDAFIIGLSFGFTPLLTALNVWVSRRRNKTSVGQFVYEFDLDGIKISGRAFDLKLKWEALWKVRETKKFFLFFVSPRAAQFLPKRCIVDTEQQSQLRQFVLSRTAK